MIRSPDPILFLSRKEKQIVVDAIQAAEKITSGEIRVHLERKAKADILDHAREVFERLGMAQTAERNGVLIFLGVRSRRFAIVGDQGIHDQVGEGFWNEAAKAMSEHFQRDDFAEGLRKAIQSVGDRLAAFFSVGGRG